MGLRTKIYFFAVCLFKFSYFLNLKCCMMKGRKRDTQAPSVGSILTNPPKIKVRWSFPRGWQGCISKKLDENSSAAGTWTGTPIWEGDIPNSGVTCCDTTPAPDQRYKLRWSDSRLISTCTWLKPNLVIIMALKDSIFTYSTNLYLWITLYYN